MKWLFDQVALTTAKNITNTYSTSFSSATKLLHDSIRQDIYNIYGFVRFADEIVDTFHDYEQEELLNKFEDDYYHAYEHGISLNPVIHAFQETVRTYNIDQDLIKAFLKSMRMDLTKDAYLSQAEYEEYIYGSADVVGLMCLKVFVEGDEALYDRLKIPAMKLGSAFQKVNFLRDIKFDNEQLSRTYFPDQDIYNLSKESKRKIIDEIERDFDSAMEGIRDLPASSKLGVFAAYRYYKQLLKKLHKTPITELLARRIRVSAPMKMALLVQSYIEVQVPKVVETNLNRIGL